MRVLRMDDGRLGGSELAALATNGEAELWCGACIRRTRLERVPRFPAAADASKRIIERSRGLGVSVFLHEFARVERAVELRESQERVRGIFDEFPAGDGETRTPVVDGWMREPPVRIGAGSRSVDRMGQLA